MLGKWWRRRTASATSGSVAPLGDTRRLGIADYDWAERIAQRNLSNDAIRAFRPVAFERVGYPIRVVEERELIRYVDVFHELENPKFYLEEMHYSADEAEIIVDVGDRVTAYTAATYGEAIRPWMGPLCAVNVARIVGELAKRSGRERLTVVEIGPGSGYLAALLVKMGHRYYGTDATQSLYIWQNRLLHLLAGDEFLETAALREFSDTPHRVVHLPWWQFAELFRANPIKADVVICDHAVGELHRFALRYVLRLAKDMLEGSPVGMFLYDGHGEPHVNSPEDVRLIAESFGFQRAFHELFMGYSLVPGDLPDLRGLRTEIPAYRPSGRPAMLAGVEFQRLAADEAPWSYDFFDFIGNITARPRT